jgi:putative nucleotidyltransferase with HDIG domain
MRSESIAGKPEAIQGFDLERGSKLESQLKTIFVNVNQELWLVLSLFIIAGLTNWLVASQHMILVFYTLPTIFSAYVYGRRHAVLTALASVFLVVILAHANSGLFTRSVEGISGYQYWMELAVWGNLLLITARAMGTLYERKASHVRGLKETYFGVLTILQQFISNDKYTHNHSYRVSLYAANIASSMGFDEGCIDIRAATLLHDIGKLETSRDILYKAASLTSEEAREIASTSKKASIFFSRWGDRCAGFCLSSSPITINMMDRDIVLTKATRYPSRPEYWLWPTLTIL